MASTQQREQSGCALELNSPRSGQDLFDNGFLLHEHVGT